MKKLSLILFAFLFSIMGYAQDMRIQNRSCQPIDVIIFASCSGCGSVTYNIPPASNLALSMLPGGAYPPVAWSGGVTPSIGDQFSALKVYDPMPAYAWTSGVSPSFPSMSAVSPSCGTLTLNSYAWTTNSLTFVLN